MQLFLEHANYQIIRLEDSRLQLMLAKPEQGEWVAMGQPHYRFLDVLDELLVCELCGAEMESLQQLKDCVADLAYSVDEWFKQHNDYLATL